MVNMGNNNRFLKGVVIRFVVDVLNVINGSVECFFGIIYNFDVCRVVILFWFNCFY